MVTGTRARSYQEMVEALAEEGLPALQDTLAGLAPEDWQRPTLLRPPEPDKPPWTVLQLAAHYDVFMGLTMPLVAEPQAAQPVVDRASFYIWVSDRSKVSPVIYHYIVDHAAGHTPAASAARLPRRSARPWRRSGPRRRTPSGLGSSGRCGWMSSWPPGWWRRRCTAWT